MRTPVEGEGVVVPVGGSQKVIAFDSWTGGVSNFERLVEAFAQRSLDLRLIHLGSWGHDLGRPKEEQIGRLPVRDIRYYERMSFKDILVNERPVAVVFLSTQGFAERAFNRYCKQLGIPSLHLYHGVVCVQSTRSNRLNPVNVRSQLALITRRFYKNIVRIWPVYSKSLWETRAPIRDWAFFGYDVWRQVTNQSYSGVAPADASTTACCVYTKADIDHAVERYHMPREAVFAVGNPDLLRFGLSGDDIGACLNPRWAPGPNIVYIDTALVNAGAVFDDVQDFVRHLQETKEALARQGIRLVVKLHPGHSRTGLPQLLNRLGIEQCTNKDFVQCMKNSCAAIVEPSSAALAPGLLGLPLLLAQYGKLKEQQYGDVLTSYPKADHLVSLDDVAAILMRLRSIPKEAVSNWICENAGPLPAAEMPNRVVDVIEGLIGEHRANRPQPTARLG